MTKDEIIQYWIDSAEVDNKAMDSLFTNGHYTWALFTGHLVLEKLLKAYYAKSVDNNIPRMHHLLKIAEGTNLELTDKQKNFLIEVTAFNIEARYPDYKNRFYKKATREFTERYLFMIKEFKQWLIKKIKS